MSQDENKKILIIEDEKELAFSLAELLRSKGYKTFVAHDGLYGTSQARNEKVDLVLLDIGLPAGGGLFVLENLKRSVLTSHIPILVLTAQHGENLKSNVFKLGAQAFFSKPFNPDELLESIKKFIN